jgi:hypothetical protein
MTIVYPAMTMLHLNTLTLTRYLFLWLLLFSNPRCLTSATAKLLTSVSLLQAIEQLIADVLGVEGFLQMLFESILGRTYYAFSHKGGLLLYQLYFHFISLILTHNALVEHVHPHTSIKYLYKLFTSKSLLPTLNKYLIRT